MITTNKFQEVWRNPKFKSSDNPDVKEGEQFRKLLTGNETTEAEINLKKTLAKHYAKFPLKSSDNPDVKEKKDVSITQICECGHNKVFHNTASGCCSEWCPCMKFKAVKG